MKPLVIHHANCADGYGAAFAAWLKLSDEAIYCPRQYGQKDPLPDYEGREVYILDFSFPREEMDLIFQYAKRVVWLDHHKTAFEMSDCGGMLSVEGMQWPVHLMLDGPHHILLDNNKSGAYLAWEYFHPDTEVPMLIKHIDDHDRWQFKLEGTKAFNKALWSDAPWSFAHWKRILDLGEGEIHNMIAEGEAILRAHDQNVQSVVKRSARECEITFNQSTTGADVKLGSGLIANCPPFLTSDVGHELATQSGTFGLCWTFSQTGLTANCSLRSNGEYDVSAIAKAFGGGGHRNAAGFEVPLATLIWWLK